MEPIVTLSPLEGESWRGGAGCRVPPHKHLHLREATATGALLWSSSPRQSAGTGARRGRGKVWSRIAVARAPVRCVRSLSESSSPPILNGTSSGLSRLWAMPQETPPEPPSAAPPEGARGKTVAHRPEPGGPGYERTGCVTHRHQCRLRRSGPTRHPYRPPASGHPVVVRGSGTEVRLARDCRQSAGAGPVPGQMLGAGS